MKISDGIRNRCALDEGTPIDSDGCDGLYTPADRMDNETAGLPRDMDGLPVHVGDGGDAGGNGSPNQGTGEVRR